jgi:ubiquinone/menaquinone biosynthesis C-methylase UbiE
MHAVLTRRGLEGNRWDPDEFFAHGRREVEEVSAYLEELGLDVGGRGLDFGCGVGRLTQAFAEHAREMVGVDIARSMVDAARTFDRHADRVRYVENTSPDLSICADASFDFVYSNITLQHVPPRFVRRYVTEFFRVVRPGGWVLFQMRSGPRVEPGTPRALLYRLNREHFRRFLQRLQGKPAYEIHFLARSQVEETIEAAGGQLLDVVDVSGGRGKAFRYCAVR